MNKDVFIVQYNDCYGNGRDKTIEGYVSSVAEFDTWLNDRNKKRIDEGESKEHAEEFDVFKIESLTIDEGIFSAIAVIDLSTTTLHIHEVPEYWNSEETEEFLQEKGYKLSEVSWGEFDGTINDER